MHRTVPTPLALAAVLEALVLGCGAESSEEDLDKEMLERHGTVVVRIDRAEDQAFNPFARATEVAIELLYGECLRSFYATHPELTQVGEHGAEIFGRPDGWYDDCEIGLDSECRVTSIAQDLRGGIDAAPFGRLTVTFAVSGADEPVRLGVGPLPVGLALDTCPDAIVAAGSGIHGANAQGERLWEIECRVAGRATASRSRAHLRASKQGRLRQRDGIRPYEGKAQSVADTTRAARIAFRERDVCG